ncbi:3-dehydroquinate synthase [Leptospira sp. GIMC2001]|uniref:3-dehydroquinate synthase n=1 Tax=Leptospira sp. GIMC2001 TaxID=1513297 RepID=UPI00234A0CA3|nr:3-dehydroquinate synthase [Leptospira sp. GIMC2001]WCL48709.1 3-dehydroquinate synthase [Leptospira sp. GIMC2001]
MKIAETKVEYGNSSYPIRLYKNFIGLKQELAAIENVSQFIIITERTIAQTYLKYVESELAGIPQPVYQIYIKGSEKNKHIDRMKKVFHQLIELGADRRTVIIAMGGGVVGDFAGFIAATYQRGIRFVQIPTTLLASVDSSVGGKVAVNLDKGKNMIGSFHQPNLVYMPLFTLSTLPEKEWKCGLAEILKHSLLSGGEMWQDFKSHKYSDINVDSAILTKFIMDSVKYKAWVVSQDEKESGLRQILNLGHTTAHAIESLTNYKKYSHGEAVSIGLVTALMLSSREVGFPNEKIRDIIQVMKNYNLPTSDSSKPSDILKHMDHDKKKEGNSLLFTLLEDIGKSRFKHEIARKEILSVLKDQRKL